MIMHQVAQQRPFIVKSFKIGFDQQFFKFIIVKAKNYTIHGNANDTIAFQLLQNGLSIHLAGTGSRFGSLVRRRCGAHRTTNLVPFPICLFFPRRKLIFSHPIHLNLRPQIPCMYSSEQTHQLQKQTTALLAAAQGHILEKGKLEELRESLRFHEYRYAILNEPLISDFEYDTLYKALEKIEADNPGLITQDSPTQRVAKSLTKEFPNVQHLVPMLSLENSYNEEDLLDWDRKARELTGLEELEYCVEPKFDGASISLIYENDLLLRGVTRGDGVAGDEITTNIRQIRSVPLSAAFSRYGLQQIEIRGEVLMNKDNLKKYNEQLAEQNIPHLDNPRNAAAGSLRIKDPREVSRRNLEAFLYHVSYFTTIEGWQMVDGHLTGPEGQPPPVKTSSGRIEAPVHQALKTHSGCLKMLWDLGFRSPQKEKRLVKGIQSVIDYCHGFEKQPDGLA